MNGLKEASRAKPTGGVPYVQDFMQQVIRTLWFTM